MTGPVDDVPADDVVAALRTSPLFAQLPDDDVAALAAGGRTLEVPAGAVLMAEGAPADAMLVVLDGQLEVTRGGGGGPAVLLNLCSRGDLLGELGVLQGVPRSATVRARTAARVQRIDVDALDRLLAHPHSARALLQATARRLAREEGLLRQRERMAALGGLAAGLLHEINNPAAAVSRSAARLRRLLTEQRRTGPLDELAGPAPADSLARADAATALAGVLARLAPGTGRAAAEQLAAAGIAAPALEVALAALPGEHRAAELRRFLREHEVGRLLEELLTGAEHLSRIVTGVRPLAYAADQGLTEVDLHAGLEQALVLLRHKLPPGVRVVRDLSPDARTVRGRPADLALVWINLLDNAVAAVGTDGTITVRTADAGDRVLVDVENTGPPVPPEVTERVFDAFFTTKPVGEGTGLGLTTALAVIAQQHHGELTLTSADGVTRARVVLPRGDDDPAELRAARRPAGPAAAR
ncbi:Signal transduction histidine kinase [Blastococcus aggregatus]|uniref:histidine kinase n=1 Tax=Blastococcus aggregatus TaxID=38502 RepID=A0A285VDP0_9ACTN|nr:ATP-binding protein [Blastococcus aggregatus]SOC50591.1 Signal transduction histidine kinase [Blastococcus aggregatus]